MFTRSGTSGFSLYQPALTAAITSPTEGANLGFTQISISQDGNLIFVGAPNFPNEDGAGLATVFVLPPTIVSQPVPQTTTVGSSVTFSSSASSSIFAVQWFVDTSGGSAPVSGKRQATAFAPIAGATSLSLLINPTTAIMNGNVYRAVYSLAGVSTTTNSASLTLTLAVAGGTGSGSAAASGSPPSASASGDPHIVGADGRSFSFEGQVGAVYNLVSSSAMQVNMQLGQVRGNKLQALPGKWMVKVGVVLSSHQTIVIDTTTAATAAVNHTSTHSREHHEQPSGSSIPFEISIDGRILRLAHANNNNININDNDNSQDDPAATSPRTRTIDLAPVFVSEQCRWRAARLEMQEFHPRVEARQLGLPSSDPVIERIRLTIDSHLELDVFVVERGYSEIRRSWLVEIPRRWLDVMVIDLDPPSSRSAYDSASDDCNQYPQQHRRGAVNINNDDDPENDQVQGILGQSLRSRFNDDDNSERIGRRLATMSKWPTESHSNKDGESMATVEEEEYRELNGELLGSAFRFRDVDRQP